MTWEPRRPEEVFLVDSRAKDLYERRDKTSTYRDFQFPHRKGIARGGGFAAAVVRKAYADRGYDSWISEQSKHGVPSYLLERLPATRRGKDAAYLTMIDVFGAELLEEFHALAAGERRLHDLRTPGGDPDLFVRSRRNQADRFFVEVKLEDLTRHRPYRDTLNHQQVVLFPLIEKKLGCEVRLATVSVQSVATGERTRVTKPTTMRSATRRRGQTP